VIADEDVEAERREQLLWTDKEKKRHRAAKDADRDLRERIFFGRDNDGSVPRGEGPDTFAWAEANLGDIDGIGKHLEALHALERKYPYRIPRGQ